MRARRRLVLALLGAGMVAATNAAPLLAQAKDGGDRPVTLSLAVWDQPGRQRPSRPPLTSVALAPEALLAALSPSPSLCGGWAMPQGSRSGEVDLAILATREWSPLAGREPGRARYVFSSTTT